jgi:hypothetical protein
MLTPGDKIVRGLLLTCGLMLTGGCLTEKTTDTPRSGTEQLLLSTATDHALKTADLSLLAHRKVFLDATYFDSYDSKYVLGSIRDALSRAGAILQDTASASDIIVEARSGALATDSSDALLGLPSMAVPIPLAGPLQTPELAFYKNHKQRAVAKIALLVFARETHAHIYSTGPLDGKSYDKHYNLLFISWIRTDLPEKKSNPDTAEKYQTWFPQTDLINLPSTNVVVTNSVGTNSPADTTNATNKPAK